jgi:hypothetical protein
VILWSVPVGTTVSEKLAALLFRIEDRFWYLSINYSVLICKMSVSALTAARVSKLALRVGLYYALLKYIDFVSGDWNSRKGRRAVLCPVLAFLLGVPWVSFFCCGKKRRANTKQKESWRQKLVYDITNSRDMHYDGRSACAVLLYLGFICVPDARLRSSKKEKTVWIVSIILTDCPPATGPFRFMRLPWSPCRVSFDIIDHSLLPNFVSRLLHWRIQLLQTFLH